MRPHSASFLSFDNTRLLYRAWLIEQPKGNLVIVHGAGEHSLRYQHIVDHFTAAGFNVFTWDARGHGESEGQRGYVERWRCFRQDIHYYFKAIHEHCAEQPIFLLGHSLGGLMSLDYLLHFPHEAIRGYISSSPAIGKVGISPFLMTLSKVLTRIAPRLSMDTGLDITAISRDKTWIESTRADKRYHSRGTPRLGVEVVNTAKAVQDNADKLNYPILMIHGTADTICDISGTRQFFGNTTQVDKTLKEYEGGYHELFNDIEKERVLNDVQQWLEARL